MHVVDALVMVVDGAQHIAAGKGEVASVEQERNAFAGIAHESVELRLGLDHRRHVVMVGERHALVGAPLAEFGDAAAIGLHLVVGEFWLGGQRLGTIALDRAADLAIDDAGCTNSLEQVDHRLDAILVPGQVLIDQRAGEPAAAKRDVGFLQDRQHHLRVVGEAAAHLHAGEAGRARLAQTFLQRHVIAQFHEIVVPPRYGGHAQFGFQVVTPVSGCSYPPCGA